MDWPEILKGDAVTAAPYLLGAVVQSTFGGDVVRVRLTEVEAYGGVGEDPGSHAHRGRTARNAPMFGAPGTAYVYLSHGIHHCLNVVCAPPNQASAVLLRAGEVIEGVDVAGERSRAGGGSDVHRDLARGPGRLARILGIDRLQASEVNGADLLSTESLITLASPPAIQPLHLTSPRTGVSGQGADRRWRFYLPAEPTVSPYRRAAVRRGHLRP
jgi:DNA-3-methyladenine glycosylase